MLLDKLQIDDPISAFPVHGICGIWGVLATGLFQQGTGLFTGDASIIGVQIYAFLCIFAWAAGVSAPIFIGLKAAGLWRVSEDAEIIGLDHEFAWPGTHPKTRSKDSNIVQRTDEEGKTEE